MTFETKRHKEQITMNAFKDELQKTAEFEKLATPAALLRMLPSLAKGLRFAAKTSPGRLLKHAPKGVLKKPNWFQRAGGEAVRNTKMLFKNPKQLLKEQLFSARHRTVAAKKIQGGHYKTRFGNKYKVQGYNRRGQAVIKRHRLGAATLGFGFTGIGMGGLELATNKTDAQGRPQSMGKRLMGAGGQAAL